MDRGGVPLSVAVTVMLYSEVFFLGQEFGMSTIYNNLLLTFLIEKVGSPGWKDHLTILPRVSVISIEKNNYCSSGSGKRVPGAAISLMFTSRFSAWNFGALSFLSVTSTSIP